MSSFFAAVEALPLAAALRGSVWAYPLVNAAHIVGIALLFGAIVPLDLRLAGAFPWIGRDALARVLVPVAVTGFVIAIVAGSLLFMTDAVDYFGSTVFRAKMIVIALALANTIVGWRLPAWRTPSAGGRVAGSRGLRAGGIASAALWLAAIILGRLVGYF